MTKSIDNNNVDLLSQNIARIKVFAWLGKSSETHKLKNYLDYLYVKQEFFHDNLPRELLYEGFAFFFNEIY